MAYTLHVEQSQPGTLFAARWLSEIIASRFNEADRVEEETFKMRRKLLHAFQTTVMDEFVNTIIESPRIDDGFLEDDDQDVVDTYKVYADYVKRYPGIEVISIIPIDLTGTFGFIIEPKDMTQAKIIRSRKHDHNL
jgi:hypothetical protein